MPRILPARNSHHSALTSLSVSRSAVVARHLREARAVPHLLVERPPLLLRVVGRRPVARHVEESAGRRVERVADRFEVGAQLRLFLRRDRPVVERRAPVGRALVHGQRGDLVGDRGDQLHAARSRADHGDALADEVDRRLRPQTGVVRLAAEAARGRERPGRTAATARPSRRSARATRIGAHRRRSTAQVAVGLVEHGRRHACARTGCGGAGRTGRPRG